MSSELQNVREVDRNLPLYL